MMTRFLLGVAVGYLFSDLIDELLGKTKEVVEKEVIKEDKPEDPGMPS